MTDLLPTEGAWGRLSPRVVWVDVVMSLISLLPGAIAITVFGVEPTLDALGALAFIAAVGIIGAIADILRWAFTRFRITPADIERRTGLFVRRHRTIHRDRVRSVDTSAKLRHRVAGLRVVTIGAGQQTGAGESALVLNALSLAEARALREALLGADPVAQQQESAAETISEDPGAVDSVEVYATFRARWVLYNMFSIWAFVTAAGLLWGAYWFVMTFGVNAFGIVAGLVDWESLGWARTAIIAFVAVGIVGAVGMGINFVVSYGRFELARVRSGEQSYLRTRRGLLSTREVNRDESRVRGMSIGEPVLWRWIGMADTNLITTGLSVWSPQQPAAILPRGPLSVARSVARNVFGAADPFDVALTRHPRTALRRRMWWATAISAVVPAVVTAPTLAGAVPPWVLWVAIAFWPIALFGAWVSYRALGHAIAGDYLVTRSGLLSRTTSALRRDSVSTIAIRQSLLQRRLGLATVSAMTAAGWSTYAAPDISATHAIAFASDAAPGLLDEFVDPERALGRE